MREKGGGGDETIYPQQFRTEDVNYREIEFDSYLYFA